MISSLTTIVLKKTVRQIVNVTQKQQQTKVVVQGRPNFSVVSVGLQGPVGTVAEDVLSRAAAAELAATAASNVANQAATDVEQLVTDLNNAFVFHSGAISAQGG